MRRPWKPIVAAGALLLVAAAPAKGEWTPAWSASMWEAANEKQEVAIENATVRFAVRVGAEGDRIRLRLSNEYGEPLTIGAVSAGRPGEKAVPVRFSGRPSTRVPAGATLISDAAELDRKSTRLNSTH